MARRLPSMVTALWAALFLWVIALAFVAIRLPVDNWDGFESLTNARLIAGQNAHITSTYAFLRPPLLSLLLVPLQWFYTPCGRSLWLPHLLGVLIATLAVLCSYRVFRISFEVGRSALGAALVAGNALTVHYAPFVMADLLSMLLGGAAIWSWLEARSGRSRWRFAIAGITIGFAMAAKYPMVLLPLALVLFEIARTVWPGEGRAPMRGLLRDPGPWIAGLISTVTAILLVTVTPFLAIPDLTWASLIEQMRGVLQHTSGRLQDPWWEYLETAWLLLGLPWVACALAGIIAAGRARRDADLLHLAWICIYVGLMSTWIGHKEARYLLPVVPSLVFLSLRGVSSLLPWVARRPLLGWVGAAVLLIVPGYRGVSEAIRFGNPIYTQPVLTEASCFALDWVGTEGRIDISGGRAWSFFTPDPVVFPNDEFFHFHHLSPVAFEYFVGRRLGPTRPLDKVRVAAAIEIPFGWFDTSNANSLPAGPQPLTIRTVRLPGKPEQRSFAPR